MRLDATESTIRTALLDYLMSKEDDGCVFLKELTVDSFARRADLVVANGHLAAFEIKSSADKLVRLEGQLSSYQKNFEATTVVCALNHLDGVMSLAGRGIGVITVADDGKCTEIRQPKYRAITKSAWLGFLPVVELRKLLRGRNIRVQNSADRQTLLQACLRLKAPEIREHSLAYIKLRDERNSKLRATDERKRMLRSTPERVKSSAQPDWLDMFATMGPLVAIPRKVV
ncbi:MAG: sce7726 family protein [Rhodanobacter sp.]|uniref:sce7726 family protein n=1 Tax=Castellaniella sp. TaxID=1955812 RepID=UPI003C72A612